MSVPKTGKDLQRLVEVLAKYAEWVPCFVRLNKAVNCNEIDFLAWRGFARFKETEH